MRTLLAGSVGLFLTVIAPLALAADGQPPQSSAAPTLRLPPGARPTGYALDLTVVPGAPTVTGEIAIDVQLDQAREVLWLNARSLKVTRVVTELSGTRASLLPDNEHFLGVSFTPSLPAGKHRITLSFEAEQSRKMTRGIFALEDADAWYTMTQFEADDARRAFPCFDEPGYKVPWQLTLRVPKDLVAVSNTRVISEMPGEGGLKVVRFAKTRPLPSYLVAFAVGPWEFLDLGPLGHAPTPSRIIVPRGRLTEVGFVARAYPELFLQLEAWFGIGYPFDKLDHIAIPLNVGFAMENAGLITYGARGVLAKPDAETARFRHGSASVGAHEMSHQWFGNLVTTAWWDDIWLNEAFATWIAEKMVDQWRPDYERGAARAEERADAIKADALISARQIREPITSRGDIQTAFDDITYQKGATVIAMFEGWVGQETFRRAVRSYLEARRDGSATAEDFLAALTQTSHLPVARAFNTFLDQNGVPQVEARLQCGAGGPKLTLKQHRLSAIGSESAKAQEWQIPVCARYVGGNASRQICVLMTSTSISVPLKGACPAFVFANAGGRGYYVPSYSRDLLDELASNRDRLSAGEYTSLVYDLQALVRAGSLSSSEAVRWTRLAASSSDRHVVLAAIDMAEFTGNTLVAEADRAQFERFVREVFGPRARSLGFVPRPGESDDDQLTRRALLRFMGPVDPELAAEAHRLALAWIKDRKAVDPELVDVVLMTAGRTGDAAMFDALLAEAKTTRESLDRYYLMMALFAFTDPALADKGMALLLDASFDVRESWSALYRGFYWNPTRRVANQFITANFDALAKTVGPDAPTGWPTFAGGLCSDEDRDALTAFWKDRARRYAGADREVAQTAETIQICARLRSKAGRVSFAY
jgi:cytosol alanyl aminopeptidase